MLLVAIALIGIAPLPPHGPTVPGFKAAWVQDRRGNRRAL